MQIPYSNTKPTLVARNISFETPSGSTILKDLFVSFSKEKTGLIGKNGSGKTTLLRLLVGELQPSNGSIERSGNVGYLPQDLKVHTHTTHKPTGEFFKLRSQLGLENVDITQELHTLSGGERMKTAILKLLTQNPDFLILDEPTNNLDHNGRAFMYSLIQKWPKGLLVVSHDRELLQHVDRILELRHDGLHEYGGNYSFYEEQRSIEKQAHQHDLEHAKNAKQKVEHQALETSKRQEKRNRHGEKQIKDRGIPRIIVGAMENKAEQTKAKLKRLYEKQIADADQTLANAQSKITPENRVELDLSKTHVQNGKLIAELKNIHFGFGSKQVITNATFSIYGPERIAIQGPNGSGKTTLIKLLIEDFKPHQGELRLGIEHVAYLDQHTSQLLRDKTLAENLEYYHPQYFDRTTRHWLSKFLFLDEDLDKKVSDLSGGEKMRAALAIALAGEHPPQLLILDEPTNNLDLASIEQIESALLNYQGCLIVISHDQTFLENIGITRTLTLPIN